MELAVLFEYHSSIRIGTAQDDILYKASIMQRLIPVILTRIGITESLKHFRYTFAPKPYIDSLIPIVPCGRFGGIQRRPHTNRDNARNLALNFARAKLSREHNQPYGHGFKPRHYNVGSTNTTAWTPSIIHDVYAQVERLARVKVVWVCLDEQLVGHW